MSSLRQFRTRAGLTQTQLAASSGVSRQLIGAVEAGRHLPRVDAALALATALGVEVTDLFPDRSGAVDVLTGSPPVSGSLVRAGRVGGTLVTTPVRAGRDGWGFADGIMEEGKFHPFDGSAAGFVVAGCEPGLEILETMLRSKGGGALAVPASSRSAVDALTAGRAHAAIAHGPHEPRSPTDVARFRFASWRVGIAAPPDADPGWFDRLLDESGPVVQREAGAAVQSALVEALPRRPVPGPVAASHLEAVQVGIHTGMAAVTIEPVAIAAGVAFQPLELHQVDLLVDRRFLDSPSVSAALSLLGSSRFLRRLGAFGGYDLSDHGTRVA